MKKNPACTAVDASVHYAGNPPSVDQGGITLALEKHHITSIAGSDCGTVNQSIDYPGAPYTAALTF